MVISQKNVTLEYNVLLISKDDNTANSVKTALSSSEDTALAGICHEVSDLKSYLANTDIHAVVVDVDIDLDPTRVLYELGEILHSYPDIYVIVVCGSFHKELVLRAMEVGARNFLEKNKIASELSEVFQHLFRNNERKKNRLGSIITILSAGGGCGATTVTVNLASELQLSSSKPVLAVDLDHCYGAVSHYLGIIKSQFGIADVLNHRNIIDEHLIRSSAFLYRENFHVLVSPVSIDSPRTSSLPYGNLPSVVEACRQFYGYTVIDAPRIPAYAMTNLVGLSDLIVIVFQLTIKDVHVARSLVLSLTQSGIASQNIVPLANRVKNRGHLISFEDGKKAIGLDSCHAIRNDWRKAIKSLNCGQPLVKVARGSGIQSDFQKLAAKIHANQFKASNKP